MSRLRKVVLASALAALGGSGLAGCGQLQDWRAILQGSGTSGRSQDSEPDGDGEGQSSEEAERVIPVLRGSIATTGGSQAQMHGWIVVALTDDGYGARVAEVDSAGLFALRHVDNRHAWTLALLTPDYVLAGVLSMPSGVDQAIRQYFRPRSDALPKLISDGAVVRFAHLGGLDVTRHLAADSDRDGVPDGMSATVRIIEPQGFSLISEPDVDLDGISNARDSDIDGDGVHNALDQDDNGNGLPDIWDADANGDLVSDFNPNAQNSDQHFRDGVRVVSVTYTEEPGTADAASGAVQRRLTIRAHLRPYIEPASVSVLGAASLLNGAYEVGDEGIFSWNRTLRDDGLSDDGLAGDGVYGISVLLEDGKRPRGHEAIFISLGFDRGGLELGGWSMDFPYVFAPLERGPMSLQADPAAGSVLLVGNPYGHVADFVWAASLYDDSNTVIWKSASTAGTQRVLTVPENVRTTARRVGVAAWSIGTFLGSPDVMAYSEHVELP